MSGRWNRIRRMPPRAIFFKILEKANSALSWRTLLRRIAYSLDRFSLRFFRDEYHERPEAGAVNLEVKLERARTGGPFEPPDVELINRAATTLIGGAKNILEVGSGTGMFASMASKHPEIFVTASEMDDSARLWAARHRSAPNIKYAALNLSFCADDAYDLAVAIEVVEHIENYAGFLRELSRVAPRAIVTTPNKSRSAFDSVVCSPVYDQHVREWTAGEFYWVLRVFWRDVRLYTLPGMTRQVARFRRDAGYVPVLRPCGPLTREHALLAVCASPARRAT